LKAAIYYSNNDIRIEDIPVPKISNKEILVKIMASGVCGSDVMEWYRIKKAPLILGHEVAGVVSEVGNMVKNIKEGDRVVIAHHVPCNVCYHCLLGKHTVCDTLRKTNFDPGGFCEYVRVPEINLANSGIFFLPDNVSYEEGSFVEPLACVLRAQRLIGIQAGMTVLIIGAGISGVLHIALARATGASNVIGIDISDFRIKAALENGANHAFHFKDFNQEVLKKINNNRLADVVILSTGAPQAIESALNYVERGGSMLIFAPSPPDFIYKINYNDVFWRNEIRIISSYAGAPVDYYTALQLITYKNIDVKRMITHRLPLSEIKEAFKLVSEAKASLKVIIEPHK